MSKDVDRYKVFQTTRVRTPLKNDGCWIQKSKVEKEEQDNSRTDHTVETRPAPGRQYSYVLSTAKKFESVDSPLSPPLQKLQVAPPKGNSANQANGEVVSPQKDAQPEASTVKTTEDAKPQASTEENIPNGETPPEKSVVNTTAENKEEHAVVYQPNVKHSDGGTEVSAELHVAERIKNGEAHPVSSTNPEAVSPVEPAEQPVAITTAEKKGEHDTTTAVDQSNVKHSEAKVSADAHVEDHVEEPSAVAGCKKCPTEQAAGETAEAAAGVAVESSPQTPAVRAAGEEAALQVSVLPEPDLVANTVSESSIQVKSVESKVESAVSAEPVLKTSAEEVLECQVQPVDSTIVKQSVESTPESAPDHVVELNIEDAVEPVQEKFSDRPIELSEALDVEPPTTEAAPEPLKDPKQSHTEETKLNQQSDDTNTAEMFQKSKEGVRSTQTHNEIRNTNVCSFCDKKIDGNIKIYLSEPVVTCHPDCLKCGVCAKVLGDLLTLMFLHDQMVQCGDCFAKALKT